MNPLPILSTVNCVIAYFEIREKTKTNTNTPSLLPQRPSVFCKLHNKKREMKTFNFSHCFYNASSAWAVLVFYFIQ